MHIEDQPIRAIIIGRFSPVHRGHEWLFAEAAKLSDNITILVGSAGRARDPKNPWSFEEREQMLRALGGAITPTTEILPLYDSHYDEEQWLVQVQRVIQRHEDRGERVMIVGHEKDNSSYYLKSFPRNKFIDVGYYSKYDARCMDATRARQLIFENDLSFLHGSINERVLDIIHNIRKTPEWENVARDYEFLLDHHARWAMTPYPSQFITADAIVVQSGHVLLGRRSDDSYGAGLLAIPGGYVNSNERIVDAMVRELYEETSIKVQEKIIRRCISDVRVFDAPTRSLRGRIVTHAFTIRLDDALALPRIKASSDLKGVEWVPLSEVQDLRSEFFEDHYEILMAQL